MRWTRMRRRPRATSTSCSPTRPRARWPWPGPSNGTFAHAAAPSRSDRRVRDGLTAMTIALIVAAGRGERLGADRPKALVELAGRSLVQWSIDTLAGVDGVERIVLALPAG